MGQVKLDMDLTFEDLADLYRRKGWTWAFTSSSDGIPTAKDIEKSLRERARDVKKRKDTTSSSSGRLGARKWEDDNEVSLYLEIGHVW